ncbi:K(+)-transporting ATPase subunit C [Flavobacterium sp.]|uniref:K(+)-transporting ATPase subunit C n=1 Tax=Flavobacterium sp. TaxID=239 RepID=UPI003D6AD010
MKKIISIVKFTILTIIVFGFLYPIIIWGIAQFSPNQGKGETITVKNKVVGYQKIGQKFDKSNYFWGRPSAVDYNAAGSGGSNKGPSNPDYLVQVQKRIDTFLLAHPYLKKSDIPSDMVTASGSGLDPNISVQAAKVQVKRIAKIRNIDEQKLELLITEKTEKPVLGIFGPEKINVLELNITLDKLK